MTKNFSKSSNPSVKQVMQHLILKNVIKFKMIDEDFFFNVFFNK
jgi:hypothetical protein